MFLKPNAKLLRCVIMANDLTFLDLVVLEKVQGDTVMETFFGEIGTSFFDTAALMGTMQVKGLISIKSGVGRSTVTRAAEGEKVLGFASSRVVEPLDELDHAIIKAVASGTNEFSKMQDQLNVRSEDLAYRFYKMTKQGYLAYNIRNSKTYFTLTENGFKLTGFVPKKITEKPVGPPPGITPQVVPTKPIDLLVTGGEDATKHLPQTKGPVDIKKKQAELKLMRIITPIIIIILIAAAAYAVAKYLKYI
jgi:hypothetical protein